MFFINSEYLEKKYTKLIYEKLKQFTDNLIILPEGLSYDTIRNKINEFPITEPCCIIGGPDVIPFYPLPNPVAAINPHTERKRIKTLSPKVSVARSRAKIFVCKP